MAKRYVEQWKKVKAENLGLLLWGDVGTGKSFVAACIANALLEQGIPVLMTNFSKILNQMGAMYSEERYRYIASFSNYSLLILDDLGIERSTEYALEQVYAVIDERYNSVLQKKSQEVSPKRQAAQEDLVGATLEYIQGMGIVKSFNLGGKSNQKMKQAIEESRARNTKLETVFGPYGMVQLFVLRLASVAIMFCSILFYLQGSMTLVYCLLMCVASFLIFSELEAAGGKSFALRLIESSIDKVNAIDDTPVMDLSGKDIAPKDTTIELQNVGFSYGNHRILNHVNLTIPAKTTTAIVGPSGSGKTTLCSLITRFWDVDEGCIKLGGTDIREYKLDSLLSNISMVFQNVFLFADSIENNIKFGKPDATHEEVVRAAKSACCRSQQ